MNTTNITSNNIIKGIIAIVVFTASAVLCAGAQQRSNVVPPATVARQIARTYQGVGPIESSSVNYLTTPRKLRKFLEKNCNGQAIVRCVKDFNSGIYKIALADGINMDFDSKGNLIDIEAPSSYSLSPTLLKAVVPGKLYNLLEHNGFKSSIEAVHHNNTGFQLDVADPIFEQVKYDTSGILTIVVDRIN